MTAFVVMFSGGLGSWAAAKLIAQEHGPEAVTLLFADTLAEDEDLYRFLREASQNVGARLVTISDGRTPQQVMEDERIIGNSRIDPCSKILKRKLLDKWVRNNCEQENTVQAFGIDWTEAHRMETLRKRCAPWRVVCPLCDSSMSKQDVFDWCKDEGMDPPRLYSMGFSHNNCAGACIKAGQAQWELLLRTNPKLFSSWEEWENRMRQKVGDHSILKDRRGGDRRTLPLKDFRERLQSNPGLFDEHEWGGCGCAI